jgi:hypothetical protein
MGSKPSLRRVPWQNSALLRGYASTATPTAVAG